MSGDAFDRLLRAARRRRSAITLALALPWIATATVVAWRLPGGTPALAAGVCMAALLLAVATARWHGRRLDNVWLQRRLDAIHPGLEDSSALLAADPSRLPPLARLQRERLLQRLPPPAAAGVRARWPAAAFVASAAAAAVVAAAAVLWPATAPGDRDAGAAAATPATAAPAGMRVLERSLAVTPPAYTGLPAQESESLDARVPEGTRLAWALRLAPMPAAVTLEFTDGRRVALARDGGHWRGAATATRSGLYRIVTSGAQPWQDATLQRLEVVRDRPPAIRVTAPAQTLSLRSPGQRHWLLEAEADDDHGIAATMELHLTMTEGSGENIGFREEVRRIAGQGERRHRRFTHRLDLDALGLAEGDDLIVRFVVRDNRAGRPQSTRSASHILRWPPPRAREDAGMDGVLQKVLPAYFASQRQIIIDAEALVAERPRLQDAAFAARSDTIAVDQRLLRLRYGQFLGEESEPAPTLASHDRGDADDLPPPPILLPTNDAEDEAEAWRALVSTRRQEAGQDGEGGGSGGTTPAGAGHGHDHAAGDGPGAGEPGRTGFGAAGNVLEEFGHLHDIPEAATLLDPKTRALLRRALGEMWQSELALRQARPGDALPPANRALALVKEIQQSDRIHLARTGTGLPPVDPGRRLSGDRTGIASRRVALPRAAVADDVPAALWRTLAAAPDPHAIDAGALQAWLAANEDRVPDPLAVMAAVDAVQRDPACAGCRSRLRTLLWPLATPPPAAPRARAGADATGHAYLDALRQEAGE